MSFSYKTLNSTDTVEFAKLTVDDIILDTKIYRNEKVQRHLFLSSKAKITLAITEL